MVSEAATNESPKPEIRFRDHPYVRGYFRGVGIGIPSVIAVTNVEHAYLTDQHVAVPTDQTAAEQLSTPYSIAEGATILLGLPAIIAYCAVRAKAKSQSEATAPNAGLEEPKVLEPSISQAAIVYSALRAKIKSLGKNSAPSANPQEPIILEPASSQI